MLTLLLTLFYCILASYSQCGSGNNCFNDTSGTCKFCKYDSGRGNHNCYESIDWPTYSTDIQTYCSLLCLLSQTNYQDSSSYTSCVCPTCQDTTTLSPEACAATCELDGNTYCYNDNIYYSTCEYQCYSITQNDLIQCPGDTTNSDTTTTCSCSSTIDPVCCIDGDETQYINQCEANCNGCNNFQNHACGTQTITTTSNNIDTTIITTSKTTGCTCDDVYVPVCCQDDDKYGITYGNNCDANCGGCESYTNNACPTTTTGATGTQTDTSSVNNVCGGTTEIECLDGYECIDDPDDDCDGNDADCSGICVPLGSVQTTSTTNIDETHSNMDSNSSNVNRITMSICGLLFTMTIMFVND